MCGSITGGSRYGSLPEFGRGAALLESLRDEVLIFRLPFGFSPFGFERRLLQCHFGSPLSLLVVKPDEALYWFKRRYNADPVFTPRQHK